MAAVFALIFVPAFAAILFMLGGAGAHPSVSTALAMLVFLMLAVGLMTGLFRLARKWEDEKPTGT